MPEQLISTETKNGFSDLMNGISRMQNGEISKILCRMGILYPINYGVSIPHLRQLVADCKPNNELAFLLWEKEIRETKILASILFEPEYISMDQAFEIGRKINNQELVEQFSKNFFSKLPFLSTLMDRWISGNDWEKMLALYSSGWYIRQNSGSIESIKNRVFWYIDQMKALEINPLHQSFLFAFQSLSTHSEMMRMEIKEKATILMSSDNCSIQRLGEEFLWLNAS
jgi:hypothetical protein